MGRSERRQVRDALLRAPDLLNRKRYEEACALLAAALAVSPDSAVLHSLLSVGLRRLRRHAEALAEADAAIAADPSLPLGHQSRAWALLDMTGGAPLALAAAREAVRLAPHSVGALEALANALLAAGDDDGADRVSRSIVAAEPQSHNGHFLVGTVALMRQDWEVAEEHLTEALALAPESAAAMRNLALVHQQTDRHTEATEWLRRAAAVDPAGHGAVQVARAVGQAGAARVKRGRSKVAQVALWREVLAASDASPPFVQAMAAHGLGEALLMCHAGDAQRNVLEAVHRLESLAAADPEADCAAPASQHDPGEAELVLADLHAAAWIGGADYRCRLYRGWLQDAAQANLVAVPVAGDRETRVERCRALAAESVAKAESASEPLSVAQAHLTAGRADMMSDAGVYEDNLRSAVAHFEAALETYQRLRVVGLVPRVQTFLAGALSWLEHDPASAGQRHVIELLESARAALSRAGLGQPLAVATATVGETFYHRLRATGDEADFERAVAAHAEAATGLADAGQLAGQAHFLSFAARCWALRPKGDRAANLDRGLALVTEAESLVTREGAPIRWAMVQADRADLLRQHPGEPVLDKRREAVVLARSAMAVPDRERDPRDWADNARVLALALSASAEQTGDPAEAVEAVALMRAALPRVLWRARPPQRAEHHAELAGLLTVGSAATGRAELLAEARREVATGLEIVAGARPEAYPRIATLLQAASDRAAGDDNGAVGTRVEANRA